MLLLLLLILRQSSSVIKVLSRESDLYSVNVKNNSVEYSCTPQPVYIAWEDVKIYISERGVHVDINNNNNQHFSPLKVMKCINFLSPCETQTGQCGLWLDGYASRTMPINKEQSLYVKFVEAKECRCGGGVVVNNNPEAAPYIVDVKIIII